MNDQNGFVMSLKPIEAYKTCGKARDFLGKKSKMSYKKSNQSAEHALCSQLFVNPYSHIYKVYQKRAKSIGLFPLCFGGLLKIIQYN